MVTKFAVTYARLKTKTENNPPPPPPRELSYEWTKRVTLAVEQTEFVRRLNERSVRFTGRTYKTGETVTRSSVPRSSCIIRTTNNRRLFGTDMCRGDRPVRNVRGDRFRRQYYEFPPASNKRSVFICFVGGDANESVGQT